MRACTSIPPSIYPSIAPAWSSTTTYPYLKLQKPLLWLAYHPCNDKVQMWNHLHSSESHWNPLWKVLVATVATVNLQSTRCLKNGLKFCGCRLKMSSTLLWTRELNPFYNMPLWEDWLIWLFFELQRIEFQYSQLAQQPVKVFFLTTFVHVAAPFIKCGWRWFPLLCT